LDKDDGKSATRWAERLRDEDSLIAIKTCDQKPPPQTGLEDTMILVIIQTPWQRERWEELGRHYLGIDATHNTTHYQNVLLFTLMARDRWGRGE
jgi:hypothetical protein